MRNPESGIFPPYPDTPILPYVKALGDEPPRAFTNGREPPGHCSPSRTCPAGIRLNAVPGSIFIDVASLVLLPAAAPAVVVPCQLMRRALNSVPEEFFNRVYHINLLK
jgi:hypothetical protein